MTVQIYSQPVCDVRDAAKAFLSHEGIPVDQRDIRKDSEDLRIWVEELHSRITPARGPEFKILSDCGAAGYETLIKNRRS
jgi:arsenate reductase-like glutaredoxin family protein